MSRARLEAILDALAAQHWELVPPDEHPDASADPFRLDERGKIFWAIRRADGCVVELTFWADSWGEISKDLRDICACEVAAAGITLYFAKITGEKWRRALEQFVWDIQGFCQKNRVE